MKLHILLFKRSVQLIPVVIGMITLVFFMQHLLGDPAGAILGDTTLETKEAWRKLHGLDKPVIEQYFTYISGLFQGDFGTTFRNQSPVLEQILPKLFSSIYLALVSFVMVLIFSIFIGVISAWQEGKIADHMAAIMSLVFISVPTFVTAPMLVWVLAVSLDAFPVSGMDKWNSVFLPALTLALPLSAYTGRMIRSGIVDVLGEDYIRTAKSKGLAQLSILVKHTLRNAFLPALTVLGMQLGFLLSGALITEIIFDWHGLGMLIYDAVKADEYNLASGAVIFMSLIYVFSNFLVDILYGVFDPRVTVE